MKKLKERSHKEQQVEQQQGRNSQQHPFLESRWDYAHAKLVEGAEYLQEEQEKLGKGTY